MRSVYDSPTMNPILCIFPLGIDLTWKVMSKRRRVKREEQRMRFVQRW